MLVRLREDLADGAAALQAFEDDVFDVMVTDIRMPGMDGRELFSRVLDVAPGTRTVLMTAFGSIKDATDALARGAENYLAKPFETEELVAAVSKAGEKARLMAENRVLREQVQHDGAYAGLVGRSRAMRKLYRTIDRVARAESA